MCFIKEWDMTESLEEIQILAVEAQETAFAEYKEEVFKVWKLIYLLLDFIQEKGILSLEEKLEYLKKSNIRLMDILTNIIMLLVNGENSNIILEVMINDFYTRKLEKEEIYISYLYMISIKEINEHHYDYILDFSEKKFADEWLWKYLSFVPKEYQKELLEYIGCKRLQGI